MTALSNVIPGVDAHPLADAFKEPATKDDHAVVQKEGGDEESESSGTSYDPPVFVAAQLGTEARIRHALRQALADIHDPKYKEALVCWTAQHLKALWMKDTEKIVKKVPLGQYVKVVIDGLCSKSPASRQKWFTKKVEKMLSEDTDKLNKSKK